RVEQAREVVVDEEVAEVRRAGRHQPLGGERHDERDEGQRHQEDARAALGERLDEQEQDAGGDDDEQRRAGAELGDVEAHSSPPTSSAGIGLRSCSTGPAAPGGLAAPTTCAFSPGSTSSATLTLKASSVRATAGSTALSTVLG